MKSKHLLFAATAGVAALAVAADSETPKPAAPAPAIAADSPLHGADAPAETDAVAREAMRRPGLRGIPDPSSKLQVMPPMAVYSPNLDAIASGKGLSSSSNAGTFAAVVYADGYPAGSVWVRADANGLARANRIAYAGQNGMPVIMGEAMHQLVELGKKDPLQKGSYEVRLLEGGLGASAPTVLWLKAEKSGPDYVLPLASPNPNLGVPAGFQPGKLYTEAEYLRTYRPYLLEKMGLPRTPQTWNSVEAMCAHFVQRFVGSSGNGFSRMPAPAMAVADDMRILLPPQATPDSDKLAAAPQAYRIDKLELIGIAEHNPPVAFEKSRHEVRTGNLTTRTLTAFEQKAVAELKAGGEVLSQADKDGLVVIGPIRAQAACLDCHADSKVGTVLGALSFRLSPVREGTAAP